jgi:hypothetical protein
LIVDSIDLLLTLLFPKRPSASLDVRGRPWWWTCNLAGLVRLAEAARFRIVRPAERIFMPPGNGQPLARLRPKLLLSPAGRYDALVRLRGDPHGVVLAEPIR